MCESVCNNNNVNLGKLDSHNGNCGISYNFVVVIISLPTQTMIAIHQE